MKRFQRVFLAIDVLGDDWGRGLPPEVEGTLRGVRWLHEHADCELTVLTVVPEKDDDTEQEAFLNLARQRLDERLLPKLQDVPVVQVHVAVGPAAEAVIDQVQEQGCDLLVVAARRAKSGRRRIVGSVAMELLRKCPCPVLIAPREGFVGSKGVLSPVGMHELTPAILDLAAALAAERRVPWHVFHCPEYPDEGGMRLRCASIEETEAYEAQERAAAWKRLHEQCDPLGKRYGIEPKLWMSEGQPAEQIALTAEKLGVDLIVMGTAGRTGLARMIVGNTAEKVFSTIDCALLALKPQGSGKA